MVFLILCVLLFGASAVWSVIKWGCLAPVVLIAVTIVLIIVGVPFNEYMKDATRPAAKKIERTVPQRTAPGYPVPAAIVANCSVVSARRYSANNGAVAQSVLYEDCVVRSMLAR